MNGLTGDALISEGITTKPIFSDALSALQPDGKWVENTMGSIKQLYDDPPEDRAHSILAVVRFMAIAEELRRRKVVDRPFWLLPDDQEMQVSPVRHHHPQSQPS